MLVACWLLHDEWFVAAGRYADAGRRFLGDEIASLAGLAAADQWVRDAERREELARLALRALDLRPAGESLAQAQDRLVTVSSAERARTVAAAARLPKNVPALSARRCARRPRKRPRRKSRGSEPHDVPGTSEVPGTWRVEYSMDNDLIEAQRHPLLTDADRALLRWLHEHPAAPRFNHRCGDRLTSDGLARVRAFGEQVTAARQDDRSLVIPSSDGIEPSGGPVVGQRNRLKPRLQSAAMFSPGHIPPREGEVSMTNEALPAWVMPFAAWCYRDVPFYRGRGRLPADFAAIPTCDRGNLGREPWRFVPDSQPLDDLIVYTTSGTTTGHSLEVLSHPEVAAMYLPLLEAALATRGVRLTGGDARVSVVLVCWQRRTYTYATVLSYLGGAGYAKINLNPADWRDPGDRIRYLDACDPEIYTGDPLAFTALAELPLTTRPRALISTAMTLLPGLRRQLEARFGCPVLDLYSLNEAGPVAVAVGEEGVFTLLQPRLYVEVLAPDGSPCPPGVRGEIALTGGFNPFLPLLRYRTGDTAALGIHDGRRMLLGLEGRLPVLFRGRDGRPINNVDVSAALRPLALAQFNLHQAANGDLTLRVCGDLTPPSLSLPDREGAGRRAALRAALLALFGADQPLTIETADTLAEPGDKVATYTSAESGVGRQPGEAQAFGAMSYQPKGAEYGTWRVFDQPGG